MELFVKADFQKCFSMFWRNPCRKPKVYDEFCTKIGTRPVHADSTCQLEWETRGQTCVITWFSAATLWLPLLAPIGTQRSGGKGRYPAKLHVNLKLTCDHTLPPSLKKKKPDRETRDKQKNPAGSNLICDVFLFSTNVFFYRILLWLTF